jgi:hypothetical protein
MVMTSLSRVSTIATFAAALLLATASGHARAESAADPKSSDVATLRQLLALQYPALRQAGVSSPATMPPASLTAEPDRGDASRATIERGA